MRVLSIIFYGAFALLSMCWAFPIIDLEKLGQRALLLISGEATSDVQHVVCYVQ